MKITKILIGLCILGIIAGCSPSEKVKTVYINQTNTELIKDLAKQKVDVNIKVMREENKRNDIQYYNTEKQDWCENKFKDDENIEILKARGISMNPTIADGNKLICDYEIKEYRPGMIIKFQEEDKFLVHRIKAVYGNYVITQGDNNFREDGHILKENINCVVVGVCY